MGDGLRGSETGDRKDQQNQSRPMLAGTHLHENLKSADCGVAVTRRRELQRPSLAEWTGLGAQLQGTSPVEGCAPTRWCLWGLFCWDSPDWISAVTPPTRPVQLDPLVLLLLGLSNPTPLELPVFSPCLRFYTRRRHLVSAHPTRGAVRVISGAASR